MKFYKMQGAGNDYIFFDCMKNDIPNPEELAVRLSDRHFSIGGDGIILLCPSDSADFKMRMFNADGSEGKMCGNGIRCICKLAHDLGYVKGDKCYVETTSGIKRAELFFDGQGKVGSVNVDMGEPVLEGSKIPSVFSGKIINQPLTAGGKTYFVTLVSMGNPHCVTFVENTASLDLPSLGKAIETHPAFPDRINVEFVTAACANLLETRVWERGSGETLACGTGACAAAVAAVLNGYCKAGERITVRLAGGDLSVTYTGSTVYLYGRAALSFTGEINLKSYF